MKKNKDRIIVLIDSPHKPESASGEVVQGEIIHVGPKLCDCVTVIIRTDEGRCAGHWEYPHVQPKVGQWARIYAYADGGGTVECIGSEEFVKTYSEAQDGV